MKTANLDLIVYFVTALLMLFATVYRDIYYQIFSIGMFLYYFFSAYSIDMEKNESKKSKKCKV